MRARARWRRGAARFVGWSPVASSEEASDTPGDLLAYSAALDADGDGRIVLYAVWEKAPVRADVSFVKVGADQEAGTRMPLAGARFNVYRYVGDVESWGRTPVNGGSIDLASPGSAQLGRRDGAFRARRGSRAASTSPTPSFPPTGRNRARRPGR